MDGAGAVSAACAATEDAPRGPAAVLNGVDDSEQVDLIRGRREPISASSTLAADDDASTNKVGQDVGKEAGRDVHGGGDPAGAHGRTIIEGGDRDHRPDGVIAAERELELHG